MSVLPQPAVIDWSATPRQQVEAIVQAVSVIRYSKEFPYPRWPEEHDFRTPAAERQLAAAFEGQSWVWRRSPVVKLVHTRGAVAMFRLEFAGGGGGPFAATEWCVGRYSRAADPDLTDSGEFPPVPGIALKFPRMRRPALDILLAGEAWEDGKFSDTWGADIVTALPDPRDSGRPLPKLVLDVLNGFDEIVRALELKKEVTAVSLPPPVSKLSGTTGQVKRLIWAHTPVAVGLLKACGDHPFSKPDFQPIKLELESTLQDLGGEPWATLQAELEDAQGTTTRIPLATVYLESRFHVGPVGDHWLHFAHPRSRR